MTFCREIGAEVERRITSTSSSEPNRPRPGKWRCGVLKPQKNHSFPTGPYIPHAGKILLYWACVCGCLIVLSISISIRNPQIKQQIQEMRCPTPMRREQPRTVSCWSSQERILVMVNCHAGLPHHPEGRMPRFCNTHNIPDWNLMRWALERKQTKHNHCKVLTHLQVVVDAKSLASERLTSSLEFSWNNWSDKTYPWETQEFPLRIQTAQGWSSTEGQFEVELCSKTKSSTNAQRIINEDLTTISMKHTTGNGESSQKKKTWTYLGFNSLNCFSKFCFYS